MGGKRSDPKTWIGRAALAALAGALLSGALTHWFDTREPSGTRHYYLVDAQTTLLGGRIQLQKFRAGGPYDDADPDCSDARELAVRDFGVLARSRSAHDDFQCVLFSAREAADLPAQSFEAGQTSAL